MSAERATYLDSSAIVKLAVQEPESAALRRFLRRRRPLVSSALARTEVTRALLPLGPEAVRRGQDVLGRIELARINDRVLTAAGMLLPPGLRSLDAIHLATAQQLGEDFSLFVTYDDRLAEGAKRLGRNVASPT
jgi:predicted nucleic acid-binding protein